MFPSDAFMAGETQAEAERGEERAQALCPERKALNHQRQITNAPDVMQKHTRERLSSEVRLMQCTCRQFTHLMSHSKTMS